MAVFVGCVIGFLAVGILIGSFLGIGLMKLSQNCKRKIDISIQKISSKSDIDKSQKEATYYDEINITHQSSCVDLSQNIAYGQVKKN